MDLKKAYEMELNDLIHTLEQQGIVNNYIHHTHGLNKDLGAPYFFMELAHNFCSGNREDLTKLAALLDAQVIVFYEVGELVFKMQGGASSIGGCRMAQACKDLYEAATNINRDECIFIFHRLKQEFALLEEKLGAIIELERKIIMLSF